VGLIFFGIGVLSLFGINQVQATNLGSDFPIEGAFVILCVVGIVIATYSIVISPKRVKNLQSQQPLSVLIPRSQPAYEDDMKRCKHCGGRIKQVARYCTICGEEL
jgi:hypothetical protein